jgi:hypothetical protein
LQAQPIVSGHILGPLAGLHHPCDGDRRDPGAGEGRLSTESARIDHNVRKVFISRKFRDDLITLLIEIER